MALINKNKRSSHIFNKIAVSQGKKSLHLKLEVFDNRLLFDKLNDHALTDFYRPLSRRRRMNNSGKKNTDDDEVEQLLRAAQDDMLLKLNLNSHMARASVSTSIDPDLDRRFEALKRPQKPAKIGDPVKNVLARMDSGTASEVAAVDGDLSARFAALKNSIPSNNRNGVKSNLPIDVSINQEVKEDESEDEVEKVIKWAMDAARLDPSPPSDDDDNNHGSDDDDDGVDSGKKGK